MNFCSRTEFHRNIQRVPLGIALCAAACSGYGGSGSGGESLAPPGTGDSEAEISDAADADAVSSNRNATFEIAEHFEPLSGEQNAYLLSYCEDSAGRLWIASDELRTYEGRALVLESNIEPANRWLFCLEDSAVRVAPKNGTTEIVAYHLDGERLSLTFPAKAAQAAASSSQLVLGFSSPLEPLALEPTVLLTPNEFVAIAFDDQLQVDWVRGLPSQHYSWASGSTRGVSFVRHQGMGDDRSLSLYHFATDGTLAVGDIERPNTLLSVAAHDRDVFHTTAWTDPSSGEDYALLERWSLTPEQRWAKAIFRDANADGQRVHALAPTTDGRVFVLGEYQRRFTLGGITLLGDESATGTREDYFMAEFDQRGDLTSLLSLGGTHDVRYMNPRWTSRGLLLTVQPLTGNPASSDSPAYVALWRPSAP